MKFFKKAALAGSIAALGLLTALSAFAIPTNVQLNVDGVAGYDITGINEFDWQSSGDLAIVNILPGAGSVANGIARTTFGAWAANAVVGDTVTFNIYAHARLNDLLNSAGGSVAPSTLDKDGAATGDAGFEITAALNGVETATLIAPGILQFNSITGTYKYFFDTTPDSDVGSGLGFLDGTEFLAGSLGGTNFGTFTFGLGGSSLLRNTVASYNNTFIETDPLTNAPLVGTTFDTLVSLVSTGEAAVGVGDPIGLLPYTVALNDLVFKADANSEFEAGKVPEPSTALLAGIALLGLGLSTRRRSF